jgi:hypothetical protein
MGRAGELRSVHKILVRIIVRKRSLGRPRVNESVKLQ